MSYLIPTVIEKERNGERAYDLYSRLLKDRIIFLSGEVNTEVASVIIAQLLFLEKQNDKLDIQLFINSPGGSITAGMAIFDTMRYIKCDVATTAVGIAASMGAFLTAAGTKGKRFALPNSEIMIHQPLIAGGIEGTATDLEISINQLLKVKKISAKYLAEFTGQPLAKILKDVERDKWLSADEAKKYGLVDKVVTRK